MPELSVKENRLPELHIPEISRAEILRSAAEIRVPDMDLPRIDLPSVDAGRALLGPPQPLTLAVVRSRHAGRWQSAG